jgi:hypothetical protein
MAGADRGEPHRAQNRAEASWTGAAQAGQAAVSAAPQPAQKRSPGRAALPQAGQAEAGFVTGGASA